MTDAPRRVALVEPYLGGSHAAWAVGYAAHSAHEVQVFGLPAIHWKWRMQGGHVSVLPLIAAAVELGGPFDAMVATSMTNVAALLGVGRRALGDARVVLYLHENQLTFPLSPHDEPDLTYAMINWTSMLAADRVVFNSRYHRHAWFDALPGFLRMFPDHRHTAEVDSVRSRSTVLPVGADLAALVGPRAAPSGPPLVLWNQRWEYDKGPSEFAAAIRSLLDDGVDVRVALAGDRPADEPLELGAFRRHLGSRLVHDGHVDTPGYHDLLRRADVVVSAARHEFFGVAITEAVAAGAFPVLPNRLVYPERIPAEHHDVCLYDEGGLVERLRWAIEHPDEIREVARALRPAMLESDWSVQAPLLDDLVDDVLADRER